MSKEAIWSPDGTILTLETTGDSGSLSNGAVAECTSDDRQPTDDAGFPLGFFELDTDAGGFSGVPTAGAVINVFEQTINSNSVDSPDVTANFLNHYIGGWEVPATDGVLLAFRSNVPWPINPSGGKYWIQWVDGGAGTVSMDAGWTLRMQPTAYVPAA